jgi:hypothetical protein
MSRPRNSISMNGEIYARLEVIARANGEPVTAIVERLLVDIIGEDEVRGNAERRRINPPTGTRARTTPAP